MIKFSCYSDLHFGRYGLDVFESTENFLLSVKKDLIKFKPQVIVIAGDLYDRLLSPIAEDILTVDETWVTLLKLCGKYQAELWVVEGTKSHDFGQPRRLVFLNKTLNYPCKLIYHNTITLEESLGLKILFVPDLSGMSAVEQYKQVESVLQGTQPDIAIMHGAFDYQADYVSDQIHTLTNYTSKVKHFIVIGHIHVSKCKPKVIAPGSFERLKHGEEEPKGHYHVTLDNNQVTTQRIINNKAIVFHTIDLPDTEVASVGPDDSTHSGEADDPVPWLIQYLESKNIPDGSRVALKGPLGSPFFDCMSTIRLTWPTVIWTKLVVQPEKTTIKLEPKKQAIEITPDNIVNLVKTRLEGDVTEPIRLLKECVSLS